MKKCTHCNNGYNTCTYCGGSGMKDKDNYCPACVGAGHPRGKEPCYVCDGKGYS